MRMKALISSHPIYRKAILYDAGQGVYLFLFDSTEDGDGLADEWYPSRAAALDIALDVYGVPYEAWTPLDDPLPGMRHDREAPVPVGTHAHPAADGASLDQASPDVIARVSAALHEEGPLRAMRVYMAELGVGLAEAKLAVERLTAGALSDAAVRTRFTELLVQRPLTTEELVAACTSLLAIPVAQIGVTSDIASHRVDPAVRLICEVTPVRGDFAVRLGLYPQDAGLLRAATLSFSAQLAQRLGCACLASDASPNPYTWLLIRPDGQLEPVALDAFRLDQGEYVLAGTPDGGRHSAI
jgi:hypothetical protein